MVVLSYIKRKVYTQAGLDIRENDVLYSTLHTVKIRDAYFFTLDGDRVVHKTDFDLKKVKDQKMGLGVDILHPDGSGATLSIGSLEDILQFLVEPKVQNSGLNNLKGKNATAYIRGSISLIGLSV